MSFVTLPPRPESGKEHYDEAELRILEAALGVFMQHGTAGARMQDIADRAGVNKAMLHYYFVSKQNLSDEVYRQASGGWMQRVMHELSQDRPLAETVRSFIDSETRLLLDRPDLVRYSSAEFHHRAERRGQVTSFVSSPDLSVLQGRLDEAAQAGEIRPTDVREFVVNLGVLTISPIEAAWVFEAILGITDPAEYDAFIEQRATRLSEYVMRGFRPD
jgi:AcrR family transcriptional regulator